MSTQLSKLNNNQVLTGVTLMSSLALSAYSVKNIIDLNKKIDEIYYNLDEMKKFINEQNRKSNINMNMLNNKIEETERKLFSVKRGVSEPKIVEVEDSDDVESAFTQLMNICLT